MTLANILDGIAQAVAEFARPGDKLLIKPTGRGGVLLITANGDRQRLYSLAELNQLGMGRD